MRSATCRPWGQYGSRRPERGPLARLPLVAGRRRLMLSDPPGGPEPPGPPRQAHQCQPAKSEDSLLDPVVGGRHQEDPGNHGQHKAGSRSEPYPPWVGCPTPAREGDDARARCLRTRCAVAHWGTSCWERGSHVRRLRRDGSILKTRLGYATSTCGGLRFHEPLLRGLTEGQSFRLMQDDQREQNS